jgi:hypothetical protein
MNFKYTATINELPIDDDRKFVERLTGTLEADSHAHATKQVQSKAFNRCRQLERERGDIYGYENVQVEICRDAVPDAPMSLGEYQIAWQNRSRQPLDLDRTITLTVGEMIKHERKRIAEFLAMEQPHLVELWAEED